MNERNVFEAERKQDAQRRMKIQEIEAQFKEKARKQVAEWEVRLRFAEGRVNYGQLCVCFGVAVLVCMLVQRVL